MHTASVKDEEDFRDYVSERCRLYRFVEFRSTGFILEPSKAYSGVKVFKMTLLEVCTSSRSRKFALVKLPSRYYINFFRIEEWPTILYFCTSLLFRRVEGALPFPPASPLG